VYGHIRNRPETEELEGQEGVAQLLERLLTYGSERLDRVAFQQALDAIGAREHAGTDFSVQSLGEHFERAVQLLADNELHPALPDAAMELIRGQVAAGVAARNASPGLLTLRLPTDRALSWCRMRAVCRIGSCWRTHSRSRAPIPTTTPCSWATPCWAEASMQRGSASICARIPAWCTRCNRCCRPAERAASTWSSTPATPKMSSRPPTWWRARSRRCKTRRRAPTSSPASRHACCASSP